MYIRLGEYFFFKECWKFETLSRTTGFKCAHEWDNYKTFKVCVALLFGQKTWTIQIKKVYFKFPKFLIAVSNSNNMVRSPSNLDLHWKHSAFISQLMSNSQYLELRQEMKLGLEMWFPWLHVNFDPDLQQARKDKSYQEARHASGWTKKLCQMEHI